MTAIPVPYLGVIDVEGDDAGAFLQSQLSADIDALEPGDCVFACYCTPRGQVIALLLVCRLEASFRLVCATELTEAVLKRLRLYVMRARATFSQRDDVAVLGHADSGPDTVFQAAGLAFAYGFGPAADDKDVETWKARELGAGLTWLGPATTEQFIPQMLGYEGLGALNFKKGCYPGQEIVARAHYLGKVKRGIQVLKLSEGVECRPMDAVSIERDGEWTRAKVLDSVVTPADETVIVVHCAREPESPVSAIEIDGASYRCATM